MLVKSLELKHKDLYPLFLTIVLVFSCTFLLNAQEHKKGETIFGLEVKGIIPSTILNAGEQSIGNDSIQVQINSDYGFAFGMIIRHNFTKMFTLETGIHMTRRFYPIDVNNTKTSVQSSSKIEYISYEIPIQWLLYIRMTEHLYMNTILGTAFDIYPSDVIKVEDNYAYIIQPKSWLQLSLLASVGFEYRTAKMGYFYFGATIHRPFTEVANLTLSYYEDPSTPDFINFSGEISGTYLSLDLRYFFNKKEKKVEPKYY